MSRAASLCCVTVLTAAQLVVLGWLLLRDEAGAIVRVVPSEAELDVLDEIDTAPGRRWAALRFGGVDQPTLFTSVEIWAAELDSDDAASRAHGGECLHMLLAITADRADSRGRANSTPIRREAFDEVGIALAAATWRDGRDVEPAARTLIDRGLCRSDRMRGMEVLVRVRSSSGDAAVRDVVNGGDASFRCIALALRAAAERGMHDLLPRIVELRAHYHTDVRTAAIDAAARLGRSDAIPDPAPERPTPLLAGWFERALQCTAKPVGAEAPWLRATLADFRDRRFPDQVVEGFVITDDRGEPESLLLADGSLQSLDGATIEAAASLAAFAESLQALRARLPGATPHERWEIDHRLGFAFAREHGGAELLTAARLHQRSDDEHACELVMPLLRAAGSERQFFEDAVGDIAAATDAAMIDALVEQRDLPCALAIAQRLARAALPSTPQHERAVALAAELPARLGDFRELVLPTFWAWQEMKETLPRLDQVRFLIARLRLLDCPGISPGWVEYDQPQYEDGRARASRSVVNPFEELLAMDLAAEELELLLPLLGSREHILAFDGENLHHLCQVAAVLVDAVARSDLADCGRVDGDDTHREQVIAEIRAWCRRFAGKSTAARLEQQIDELDETADPKRLFWDLYERDEDAAIVALLRLVARQPSRAASVARLLVLLVRRDVSGDARRWLSRPGADAATRLWASLLVVAAGHDADGSCLRAALTELESADANAVHVARPILLDSERPEARAFLAGRLRGHDPDDEPDELGDDWGEWSNRSFPHHMDWPPQKLRRLR